MSAGESGSQTITLVATEEDQRIARLTAAAITLALVDAAVPMPLPGVKPGLANIVTLIVLIRFGWRTAAWVSGLRVLVVSLLVGQLFAPGFFLSLTGTVASLSILALAQHLPRTLFGPVSLSIIAAFGHIGGQLLLARLWLVPHDGVLALSPIFALAALGFGTVNGLIVARLLEKDTKDTGHEAN